MRNTPTQIKIGIEMQRNVGMEKVLKLILIGISILIFVGGVYASGSGVTGYSQTGCTCHSDTADPGTTVSITGIPNQFTPGDTYLLTINVTSTTVSGDTGGFDLSVSGGTLSTTDPNAKIVGNEATHKNNNARSWQVNWTAPTGVDSVTFYVAGLASNGAGTNGDTWAKTSYGVVVIPEFPGVTLLLVLAAVTIVVLFFTRKRFQRLRQ